MKRKGIDISTWQGDIDFNKVKADGIGFVIIRSSFRHTVDSKFKEYVEGCKKAGLDILGVYHFSYALNVAQATAEAKFCLEQVTGAGLSKDTLIFFDFEYDTVKKAAESGVTLTPSDCLAHAKAFCEYVTKQGYKAGIYCNLDYYNNWYQPDLLSKYDIWLADYSGEPDYSCHIQQYTNKGKVDGISGNVDMDYQYVDSDFSVKPVITASAKDVVDLVKSWIGKKVSDGSYKEIIDIYNSYTGKFPRGVKMEYNWPWCAATWSALAIKLGYTAIMPIEISVGYLVEQAQKMGCWIENDAEVPKPGYAICYDWDDSGKGDNVGWPDHVGTVIYVNEESGYMIVTEGNYDNAVKNRTISINGLYIRGFIAPEYSDYDSGSYLLQPGKDLKTIAHEVIAGIWGNGDDRKEALTIRGYDYDEVQSLVNEILNKDAKKTVQDSVDQNTPVSKQVLSSCYAKGFNKNIAGIYKTTDDLYCRNDAGTNKKALCIIPKGCEVTCYGYYTDFNGVRWLYVQFTLNGTLYTGFCSSKYLKKK